MSTDDKYAIPQAEINAMAEAQAAQFRRERYGHVLNLIRFEKQKEAAADDKETVKALDEQIAQANAAVSTIEQAIDITLDQIAPVEE